MATATHAQTGRSDDRWYTSSAAEVTKHFAIDPTVGLSNQPARELRARNGPNALPTEPPVATWRRFAEQYTSYIQMILIAAAIVSLAIREWTTGVLLVLLITIINPVVGMRQEGKAESARSPGSWGSRVRRSWGRSSPR
jgi:Ca2+-transporting ATPase